MYNSREEAKEKKLARDKNGGLLPAEPIKVTKATWMADGTHWPGAWLLPSPDHTKGDHAGILQVTFFAFYIYICCVSVYISQGLS